MDGDYDKLMELTARLRNFDGPKDSRQELADSIQSRLRDYERQVQMYQLDDQLDDPSAKRVHRVTVDKLQENVKLARQQFRAAQLESKRNSERNWRQQRELLFSGATGAEDHKHGRGDKSNLSVEDRLVQKSQDITHTLSRIHNMAQTEVVKSELNIDELDASTRALTELEQKYNAFDVLLGGSRKLIRHLEQADTWDRRYMIASLAFLATVLLWIIWRRVLKMPVMLLLWTIGRVLGVVKWTASTVSTVNGARGAGDASAGLSETIIPSEASIEGVSTVASMVASAVASAVTEAVEGIQNDTEIADTVIETVSHVEL